MKQIIKLNVEYSFTEEEIDELNKIDNEELNKRKNETKEAIVNHFIEELGGVKSRVNVKEINVSLIKTW